MPRKFYRKKRPRKRRYKRKSRRAYVGTSSLINSTRSTPLPTKFKTVMKYADQTSLNPGATLTVGHVFSCNGIYDPDITGTGHQPSGFDEIMPMYDHYVIIGAEMIATFSSRDNTNSVLVGVSVRDSNSVATDYRTLVETGRTKYSTLTIEGGQNSQKVIRYPINPNKFLSRSKPLSDPNLRGDVAANPAEQCFWHLWAAPVNGVDPGLVDIQVQINYTVVFIEPKPVGLS